MSWEDCGFKPGKIYGPAQCPRICSDCDGDHHFYIACGCGSDDEDEEGEIESLPDGLDPSCFFVCKHCETKAEAIDHEEGDSTAEDAEIAEGR